VRTIDLLKNIYTHMKKSELTQLTQIIEHIVAKEVRKQLPSIIAETFHNMMGKSVVTERRAAPVEVIKEQVEPQEVEVEEQATDFKTSLRELFAGTPVMKSHSQPQQAKQPKQYTKNPVLNQILNETTSDLRDRERLVGAAAFQGGYSPSLNMVPGFNPSAAMPVENVSEDPSFMKNVPISRPPVLIEGQTSTHAPLAALPEGISALDVVKHVQTAPEVKQALTRNYSQMMKLIDKKRGKA